MTQVKMATIVAMSNEIENFKMTLVLALTNGSALPKTDTNKILQKYILIASNDLSLTMPKRTAKTLATNVLTQSLETIMQAEAA